MEAYALGRGTSNANRPGSVTVQVIARQQATPSAATLWLARPGSQLAPAAYRPGQFITLALPSARGPIYRSYSLCGDGDPRRSWEITIKRQRGGLISNYLCDLIKPGMVLQSGMPAGSFILPEPLRPEIPLIFVATGSGITPLMSMLRALARMALETRPRVHLHYAYRSAGEAIYGRELAALDPKCQWLWQWHYPASEGARLTSAQILATAGSGAPVAQWYICGTATLKHALRQALRRGGVPATHVHFETFASPHAPAATAEQPATGAGPRIRLAESGQMLVAQPQETLLETLERGGYSTPYSCRAGACGTCRLKLLAGQVRNGSGDGLTPAEEAQGDVLSCIAQPAGDVVLTGVAAPAAKASRAANGGKRAARPAARRRQQRTIRGTLIAASLTFFAGASYLVHQTASAQATSNSSNSATSTQNSSSPSSSPSNSGTSGSSATSSGSDSGNMSTSNSNSSNGSSSVSTGSNQPTTTNSSSGAS
jgi:ferredoxin-NADP reductase